MKFKAPQDSYTEQVHIINSSDLNGYKRLFGGTLLAWIDTVAGIVSRRHCESNITTVAIDNLTFIAPAHANDTIVLCGKPTFSGKTSLEVKVDSFVEHLDGSRELINTAYVVMVALDENEQKIEIPVLKPVTDEEKSEYESAKKRKELRKVRQEQQF